MKQKWLITLNVLLFWALHLSVFFCYPVDTSPGSGYAALGFIVIFLYSFLVSVSVGLVTLVVAHLMKRFNKQASNPRLSVGILLSLLVLCTIIQTVLFVANGGKPDSLFLEIIKDGL